LWDVLIFGHDLDTSLVLARAMSISAMILGLSMLTTLCIIFQYHIMTSGIGVMFLLLLLSSIFGSNTFNTWIAFWLLLYIVHVLITRALFTNHLHGKISSRGKQYLYICMIVCMLFTLLTLNALSSTFCTCKGLQIGKLEGRIVNDPCGKPCCLETGGYVMITSSFFLMLAIFTILMMDIHAVEADINQLYSTDGDFCRTAIASRGSICSLEMTRTNEENFSNSLAQNKTKLL
jgi:hypothetical protein